MPLRILSLLFWGGTAILLAQTSLETSSAIRALNQWSSVCNTDGLLLWGESLCGPTVLVDPSTRSSLANRPDPDGAFKPLQNVYVGVLPP